jgi:hypothetical protein
MAARLLSRSALAGGEGDLAAARRLMNLASETWAQQRAATVEMFLELAPDDGER